MSGDIEGNLNPDPELLPPPLLMFREMGDGDEDLGEEDCAMAAARLASNRTSEWRLWWPPLGDELERLCEELVRLCEVEATYFDGDVWYDCCWLNWSGGMRECGCCCCCWVFRNCCC